LIRNQRFTVVPRVLVDPPRRSVVASRARLGAHANGRGIFHIDRHRATHRRVDAAPIAHRARRERSTRARRATRARRRTNDERRTIERSNDRSRFEQI
jgi:hypothetical protein